MDGPTQRWNWPNVYLFVMFLATCVSGARVFAGRGVWTIGDWLINYDGGFVRRGFAGTGFLLLHEYLRVPLVLGVVVFVAGLYALIFLCIGYLVRGARWSFWFIAAFVSPVSISSAFISASGYHKEVFFIACLALLLARLLYLQRRKAAPGWKEGVYLGVVGLSGVLSHELFAVYLPYLLVALLLHTANWRRVCCLIAVPLLLIGLALIAVITHPGTPEVSRKICASLGSSNQAVCSGSIDYLGHSPEQAREDVRLSAVEYDFAGSFPSLAMLGITPLVFSFFQMRRLLSTRQAVLLLLAFACSLSLSIALFLYGADWGRWIEIHLFSLFLLLLFERAAAGPVSAWSVQPVKLAPWKIVLLAIYATCWCLPGVTAAPKFGYLSMAGRTIHRSQARPQRGLE